VDETKNILANLDSGYIEFSHHTNLQSAQDSHASESTRFTSLDSINNSDLSDEDKQNVLNTLDLMKEADGLCSSSDGKNFWACGGQQTASF